MTIFSRMGTAIAGALVVAGLLAAQPAAAQTPAPGNVVDAIKKRGKLMVGMASFVPWAMRDKDNNWIGFEVDVAKKVAADMGVELELVPTAWDGIIPALLSSRFDTIIGGLSITPARAEQVDFTVPYSQSGTGVAASKQLAANLKWPDDFNKADVTFTCRRGAAPCKDIETMFPKATLRQFDDTAIAYQEVINGNAHAVMTSEPAPTFYTIQNPERLMRPTTAYITTSAEGFALRKGDTAGLAYFNAWIKQNTDSGWLKARHDYWFRTRDWAEQVKQ